MTTAKPPSSRPHSPVQSNVHALKPAPAMVQPPEGWVREGEFGHMAFEAGEPGRLVRLADVLKWLQSSREIPRGEALPLLCDVMPAEVMGWLYWLRPTSYAIPVAENCTFGYATAAQIEEQKATARQNALEAARREDGYLRGGSPRFLVLNGKIMTSYPEPTTPGLPALLKYLQGWWSHSKRRGATCDVLDDPKIRYATTLAIRLDKAHELWGYGRLVGQAQAVEVAEAEPATWAQLVSLRKRHAGSVWSVTQKVLIAEEKARRDKVVGAMGTAKAMASDLGISVTALNGHIRSAKEAGKRAGANHRAA